MVFPEHETPPLYFGPLIFRHHFIKITCHQDVTVERGLRFDRCLAPGLNMLDQHDLHAAFTSR